MNELISKVVLLLFSFLFSSLMQREFTEQVNMHKYSVYLSKRHHWEESEKADNKEKGDHPSQS